MLFNDAIAIVCPVAKVKSKFHFKTVPFFLFYCSNIVFSNKTGVKK
jgi:hypothetical protein